jgi:hypothetical protein
MSRSLPFFQPASCWSFCTPSSQQTRVLVYQYLSQQVSCPANFSWRVFLSVMSCSLPISEPTGISACQFLNTLISQPDKSGTSQSLGQKVSRPANLSDSQSLSQSCLAAGHSLNQPISKPVSLSAC